MRESDGLLGDREGGLRLGHVVDDAVESLDGLAHLVVLRGDEGVEHVGALQVAGLREHGVGRVGQAAGFAHLLEADRVHAAAEVLVVEVDLGVGLYVEQFAAVGVLQVVELLGVVLRQDHLGPVGGLRRAVDLLQRLELGGGLVVLGERGRELLLGHGAVVEHLVLLAHQLADLREQLGRGQRLERGLSSVVRRMNSGP